MSEIEKWFEKYGAAKVLKKNIKETIEVMNLPSHKEKALYLAILVDIKSCLLDCGLE